MRVEPRRGGALEGGARGRAWEEAEGRGLLGAEVGTELRKEAEMISIK